MRKSIILILLSFTVRTSFGDVEDAWRVLSKSRDNIASYSSVAEELIDSGLYFTSIPYLKEFLSKSQGRVSRKVDRLIDKVITKVGVRQFGVLPLATLQKASSPTVKYILAKKLFRRGKYQSALKQLNASIPRSHPVKPFALLLEGSILSIMGKSKSATATYENCIVISKDRMNKTDDKNQLRQLAINRDYCIVGIPRTQFAAKSFGSASSTYLDLSKDSYVWPEILFEEAWNSFYLRDYNRTLGKLVTYKAPIMNFIFNPEVEVLKALTYMELCLFNDAKDVVDRFYKTYQKDSKVVQRFLTKHGRDYKYYYLLAKSKNNGKSSGNKLLNKLLDNTLKDATFLELIDSFNVGREEIKIMKSLEKGVAQRVFTRNLRDSLVLQRDLIGAYVRKNLQDNLKNLQKSFEGMTYIKLEVLGRRKKQIYYEYDKLGRSRGDIEYLKRNDKQYFWTFNGEFWADELGDYVFSLQSECDR